jgi:hypothetical protein
MQDREKIMDEVNFGDFILKYEEKLRGIAGLLSLPFEESIDGLERQISVLCSKMELLSWCFAYSEMFLVNARHLYLPVKSKDLTEKDREMAVDFKAAKENLFRDWMDGLNRNIEKYLSNAQSVLATKRMELDKLGYGKRES